MGGGGGPFSFYLFLFIIYLFIIKLFFLSMCIIWLFYYDKNAKNKILFVFFCLCPPCNLILCAAQSCNTDSGFISDFRYIYVPSPLLCILDIL